MAAQGSLTVNRPPPPELSSAATAVPPSCPNLSRFRPSRGVMIIRLSPPFPNDADTLGLLLQVTIGWGDLGGSTPFLPAPLKLFPWTRVPQWPEIFMGLRPGTFSPGLFGSSNLNVWPGLALHVFYGRAIPPT